MVGNQRLGRGSFFGGWEKTSPLPPSKGEMRRASRHEQYDVGTGERLGKARKAERSGTGGTSGTGETVGLLRRVGQVGGLGRLGWL